MLTFSVLTLSVSLVLSHSLSHSLSRTEYLLGCKTYKKRSLFAILIVTYIFKCNLIGYKHHVFLCSQKWSLHLNEGNRNDYYSSIHSVICVWTSLGKQQRFKCCATKPMVFWKWPSPAWFCICGSVRTTKTEYG